jgi:hypothetical protein
MSGLGTALFVRCKSFRSFLVIPLSLDLSLSPGLLLHAHLDYVEMSLKNNSEIPQNRVGTTMLVSSELTPLIEAKFPDIERNRPHDEASLAHSLLEPLHDLLVRRHPRPAVTTLFLIMRRWGKAQRFASGIADDICV